MIYLTTDTHFGHERIKELCDRPDNFEELLITGFDVLTEDDILIHLGDVSFKENAVWHEIMNGYPCKTWLIKGNHDKKSNKWYLDKGWDFVGEKALIKHCGDYVWLSHEPMEYCGDICIHGHLHNTNHHEGGFENNIKLAVEENSYKPWRLDLVVKEFNSDKL